MNEIIIFFIGLGVSLLIGTITCYGKLLKMVEDIHRNLFKKTIEKETEYLISIIENKLKKLAQTSDVHILPKEQKELIRNLESPIGLITKAKIDIKNTLRDIGHFGLCMTIATFMSFSGATIFIFVSNDIIALLFILTIIVALTLSALLARKIILLSLKSKIIYFEDNNEK